MPNAKLGEQLANVVEAAARQPDVMRVILGAGDDARLVVRRQPHRLRLVELGILKRRQAKQPVSKARMQAFLGDVDLIAENQLQRRRQFADDRRLLAMPRRRGRPRLRLLRRPVVAAARRGCGLVVRRPGRSLRPALADLAHAREKRPLVWPRNEVVIEEDAVVLLARPLSAAAGQSGFRILLAASCPDSETDGRTNPGRCPVAPPSSR